MGSLAPPQLPVIDFSSVEELKAGSTSLISIRAKVREALEEYGCFEAYYDKAPREADKELYGELENLFNLPAETKQKNQHELPTYGYIGPSERIPLYEGVGIGDAAKIENVESFTNLMWPEGNPSFCEATDSCIQRLIKLEETVRRMVFASYGLEKYADSNFDYTEYVFRTMVYRPKGVEGIGLHDHTDKCFLTILHQNGVNGLQVQTKAGEWFTLTPSPNSYTVMTGEAFMAWSNGRLHCPHHRVVVKGSDVRYSVSLFSLFNGIVATPEELVDEEHPLLFKPFPLMDLLHYYHSNKGETGKSTTGECYTIEEFCAV